MYVSILRRGGAIAVGPIYHLERSRSIVRIDMMQPEGRWGCTYRHDLSHGLILDDGLDHRFLSLVGDDDDPTNAVTAQSSRVEIATPPPFQLSVANSE